jgi:amino acid transporter
MNYSDYKQGTYLNKLTLTISLVDEKLDIYYSRQFWVILKDKNFFTKAIDYIRNFNYSRIGWCGVITLVLLALAVIMLILVAYMRLKKELKIKRIKASMMKKIKILNIVLIFLLILSILALIMIGSPDTSKFYEPSKKEFTNSSLYHEWKENTPYQIDLNQYFTDADKDVLSYTSSQPDHVNVKIENSLVTLTPEHNWAGEEQIVFTANDKKGGVTDSPIMTLRVMKKQPVGPMAYWNTYCIHVNLVLFIILVLLVLLAFDVIEEKGYNYYLPKNNRRRR